MNSDFEASEGGYGCFDFENVGRTNPNDQLGATDGAHDPSPSMIKENDTLVMDFNTSEIKVPSSTNSQHYLEVALQRPEEEFHSEENVSSSNYDSFLYDHFEGIQPLTNENKKMDSGISRQSSAESERCREIRETRNSLIEMRRKEEAELQNQQKELALEELNEFYRKREHQIERRKKENLAKEEQMKEEGKMSKTKDKSWTRVLEMINEADRFAGSSTERNNSMQKQSSFSMPSRTNLVSKTDNSSSPSSLHLDTSKMKKLLNELAESEDS